MLLLLDLLLVLENVTVKDGLDFFQTTGLASALGWSFRQFLAFRDLKHQVNLLIDWKLETIKQKKEEQDKQEEKDLQREVVQQQILTEVRELTFNVRAIKNQ